MLDRLLQHSARPVSQALLLRADGQPCAAVAALHLRGSSPGS